MGCFAWLRVVGAIAVSTFFCATVTFLPIPKASSFSDLLSSVPFLNLDQNATRSACVLLTNPVSYHSEVEIALHSYLIAGGYPVCVYDETSHLFGYNQWFQPPATSTIVLNKEDFSEMAERKVAGRAHPLIIITIHNQGSISYHPTTHGIVVIHHYDWLKYDYVNEGNWTLLFLSPRVDSNWRTSVATNNLALSPSVTSIPIVAVWQSSTSISTNPLIKTVTTDQGLPSMVDWNVVFQTLDEGLSWGEARKKIEHSKISLTFEQLRSWRYIVVQGGLEYHRREYSSLVRWLAATNLTTTFPNLKVVLLGKFADDIRTDHFSTPLLRERNRQDCLVVIPHSGHMQYSAILDHARAVFPAQNVRDMSYVNLKSSSTIPTTLSNSLPLVADYRINMAYGQPVTRAVIEYRIPDIEVVTHDDIAMAREQNRVFESSSGTLASFDTFTEAVSWVLGLPQSDFEDLRRTVMGVRDVLFETNTNLVSQAIHRAQADVPWNKK